MNLDWKIYSSYIGEVLEREEISSAKCGVECWRTWGLVHLTQMTWVRARDEHTAPVPWSYMSQRGVKWVAAVWQLFSRQAVSKEDGNKDQKSRDAQPSACLSTVSHFQSQDIHGKGSPLHSCQTFWDLLLYREPGVEVRDEKPWGCSYLSKWFSRWMEQTEKEFAVYDVKCLLCSEAKVLSFCLKL